MLICSSFFNFQQFSQQPFGFHLKHSFVHVKRGKTEFMQTATEEKIYFHAVLFDVIKKFHTQNHQLIFLTLKSFPILI